MMLLSVVVTVLFYIGAGYMSYIASFILYTGLRYKLWDPTLKSIGFIVVCYISIIADVILLHSDLYVTLFLKNGFLTLLIIASFITARNGREN